VQWRLDANNLNVDQRIICRWDYLSDSVMISRYAVHVRYYELARAYLSSLFYMI